MPIVFSGHTVITIDPPTFALGQGETQVVTIGIHDEIGSALTGITRVALTTTGPVSVIPTDFAIPDSNVNTLSGPVPGLTQFTVLLVDSSDPTDDPKTKTASLTVTVTSPPISGGDTTCPGGNNNAFLTIIGTADQ